MARPTIWSDLDGVHVDVQKEQVYKTHLTVCLGDENIQNITEMELKRMQEVLTGMLKDRKAGGYAHYHDGIDEDVAQIQAELDALNLFGGSWYGLENEK
jgi:hypothetical protein